MASVFLSYDHEDAGRAAPIAAALEKAGHSVWWDRHIQGGAEFNSEIEGAVERADLVVVLWSQRSVRSAWVRDEAAEGRDQGKLVPVLLDGVKPPMGFRQFQTINMARWRGRAAPPELLTAIDSLAPTALRDADPPQAGQRPSRSLVRRAWPVVAMLLAIAVVAVWQVSGVRLGEREETPILAVLPFADLSREGDKAYFSEGVGEAILSLLSRERGIKVIGRSSAAQFGSGNADFREIRRALGVTHFLEGSARTAGDQLRMSVRLIDARDGTQVWAEDYQRRLSNIFAVQDEIGRAVAERLKGTLVGGLDSARQQTTSVDVYTLYLALRAKMRTREPQQLREALEIAQTINRADPDYAPAWAARAELIWLLSAEQYGSMPRDDAYQQALPHARRAVALAPDGAEGHAAQGLLLMVRDPGAAVESLTRAIAGDPSRAEARLWRALSNLQLGRKQEALQDLRRVVEMEPLWPVGHVNRIATLAAAARHAEAAALNKQFEQRGGNPAAVAWSSAMIAFTQGDLSESIRHTLAARREGTGVPVVEEFLAWAFHLASLNGAAEQLAGSQPLHSRLFVTGQRQTLLDEISRAGSGIWNLPDDDVPVMALASARDWSHLARLYDRRSSPLPVCPDRAGGSFATLRQPESVAINVAQALIATGRRDEASRLLDCVQEQLAVQSGEPIRKDGFTDGMIAFSRAQIHALRHQQSAALRSLDQAVDGGWLGLYGGRLRDYPAFDPLPDEEVRRIQAKLDRRLTRERAEILRFCSNCR